VILDYIRHYGEDRIGGMNFVDGITKLGSEEATAVLTPEFLSLVPRFFTTDAVESRQSLESLLTMCFAQRPSDDELSAMLEWNLSVPPHVRQALFSRAFDNDDLMPKIRKPVLITHGTDDAIVKPSIVDQHKANIPHAEVHMMPNTGHAPFWEDAPAYNERLRDFCKSL